MSLKTTVADVGSANSAASVFLCFEFTTKCYHYAIAHACGRGRQATDKRPTALVLFPSLGGDARELFCHACLPARPSGPPLENHIFWQTNGDQLLRVL